MRKQETRKRGRHEESEEQTQAMQSIRHFLSQFFFGNKYGNNKAKDFEKLLSGLKHQVYLVENHSNKLKKKKRCTGSRQLFSSSKSKQVIEETTSSLSRNDTAAVMKMNELWKRHHQNTLRKLLNVRMNSSHGAANQTNLGIQKGFEDELQQTMWKKQTFTLLQSLDYRGAQVNVRQRSGSKEPMEGIILATTLNCFYLFIIEPRDKAMEGDKVSSSEPSPFESPKQGMIRKLLKDTVTLSLVVSLAGKPRKQQGSCDKLLASQDLTHESAKSTEGSCDRLWTVTFPATLLA